MSDMVKFSSKLKPGTLEALRDFAKAENRHFAHVLEEAAARYLDEARLRPAFAAAVTAVLDDHGRLLSGLQD